MNEFIRHTIFDNDFLLSAARCIFWENEQTLILSDLHLGKSGHFRKHGIAIPQTIFKEDMQRFAAQIQYFKPRSLIIVGDLFHSHANREMDFFLKWRNDFAALTINLVLGNHDILDKAWYDNADINCVNETMQMGRFLFTHDINDCAANNDHFCFSGHIHPAITMNGLGKQSLKFPCFYFNKNYAVLPAFGRFTGTAVIKPKKGDAVFALVENRLMKI